jgi:thiosulfate dehydrogenase [quinone] large subunit
MPAKTTKSDSGLYVWALLRISLGFTFLWAFFDKLWGLGFATCRDAKTEAIMHGCKAAWMNGGSPTKGFLSFATKGPFADFYQNLAGRGLVDVLFMVGLLGIGLALIAGIGIRLAVVTGSLLLFMMWTAALWPANNPFLDDHLIYILVLFGLLLTNKQQKWGLRSWWVKQPLIQRFPILE